MTATAGDDGNVAYSIVDAIVKEQCAPELAACFDSDAECGRLFMMGSATRFSAPLQELLKCIDDFDDGHNYFRASVVVNDDMFGLCVANWCEVEYLRCQVSVDCFLGVDTDAKKALDICIAERCVLTTAPTRSPTTRPNVFSYEGSTGLFFEIDGDKTFQIETTQITAGNVQTIPTGGYNALEGHVVVTTFCDPASDGVAAASLEGSFLVVKRGGCNVYDTARIAVRHGVAVLAFAADDVAQQQWIPRDKTLTIPVLSMDYDVADSLQTMLRRKNQVRGRLSSDQYCDVTHAAGLDISSTWHSVGGRSCCAAGDIIVAHFLFEYDFWNVGAREFPFRRPASEDEVFTIEGAGPQDVFSDGTATVCGNTCKRNGVCEDGGPNSVGHSCPWGGDCQDCGPRAILDVVGPEVAYGWPAPEEYQAARDFICDGRDGFHCQFALMDTFDDFHGAGNVYASIVEALCLESTCALKGGLLQYDVDFPGGGPDTTCCFAAQVFAAYLLETVFHVDRDGLSSFHGLCSANGMGATFGFSCVADEIAADGTSVLRPQLELASFHLARSRLCPEDGSSGCMGVAIDMLSDLWEEWRAGTAVGDVPFPLPAVHHFPIKHACSALDYIAMDEDEGARGIHVCALIPFVEYTTEETGGSSGDGATTCCEASAAVIVDLIRQADKEAFDTVVCPSSEVRCRDLVDRVTPANTLRVAKSVLNDSPECLVTTFDLITALQKGDGTEGSESSGLGEILAHITRPRFEDYISTENVCWLQWLVSNVPIDFPVPCCAAADVLLARHLRISQPAIALDVYSSAVLLASNDDEAAADALATICENMWGSALDDFVLSSPFGSNVLGDDFSFHAMCNDPCRCTVDTPEARGCGLHSTYDVERADREHAPHRARPFCFVADPEACERAVFNVDGKAWAYCSVGRDMCVAYSGAGPCAPFVPEGEVVFVPAGQSTESLQTIVEDNTVQGWLWDRAGDSVGSINLLESWLLEAALVSPTSYIAHGQMLCNSRLRRCAPSPGDQDPQPQPLRVCKADCMNTLAHKFDHEEVSNDLLRSFDGASFGALFEAEVVCGWRLLPQGFYSTSDVSGLDLRNAKRLESILGIDLLLATQSFGGGTSTFGQHVHVGEDEDAACFGFASTDNSPRFEGGVDMAKALSNVRCPPRFVKNSHASIAGAGAEETKLSAQFCVGTCPSNATSKDQYAVLWHLYVVPGLVVLLLNAAALCGLISGTVLRRNKQGHSDPTTIMIVGLAVLSGLLGVMPVALLQEDLLCTCESELCISSGFVCKLNQTSIYVVMATCLCLLHKFATLLTKLKRLDAKDLAIDKWKVRHLTWCIPLALAMASFAVEDADNERFHLARAGVRCQFRYGTLLEESLLLHVPMGVCMVLMVYFIQASTRLCFEVMQQTHQERSFRSIRKVLRQRPQMAKMLCNSAVSVVLMIFWLSQAAASRAVFHSYFEAMDAWLRCVRFDFARHAALGLDWKDEVVEFGVDGNLCPASPTGTLLFESHLYRSLFEILMPAMVALTFSGTSLSTMVQWKSCLPQRFLSTVAPENVPLSHHGPSSFHKKSTVAVIQVAQICDSMTSTIDAIIANKIKSLDLLRPFAPEVLRWLKEKLVVAPENEDVKAKVKQLLGAPLFIPNLDHFGLWDEFVLYCNSKALGLGLEMKQYYDDHNLSDVLGPNAVSNDFGKVKAKCEDDRRGIIYGSARILSVVPCDQKEGTLRQDAVLPPTKHAVLCLSPDDRVFPPDPQHSHLWNEQCFIHCLRMIAIGIDCQYQEAVSEVCHSSKGQFNKAEIKGYRRMKNKTLSKDDHYFESYPRPSLNLDLNRNCCTFDAPNALVGFIDAMKQHKAFGGHPLRVKNGFSFDEAIAEKSFHYRSVLLNWLYTPGITYRELAVNAKEKWEKYYNFENVKGFGHKDASESTSTWRSCIKVAMAYLTSDALADEQVQFIVETQALLRPYWEGRQRMHLFYKVCRAGTPAHLHADFRTETILEMRSFDDVEMDALVEMKSFLADTSDINFQFEELQGATRLWLAAEQGHEKAVQAILQHPKINPNKVRNKAQTSPLYIASYHGHSGVVELLLKHLDIDVNVGRTSNGTTPLLVAAETGNEKVVAALLATKGVMVNLADTSGKTPLIVACGKGHEHVVALLLRTEGIDADRKTIGNGTTAFSIASQNGHGRIVGMLMAHSRETTVAAQLVSADDTTRGMDKRRLAHSNEVQEVRPVESTSSVRKIRFSGILY
jgi:hypothetical protein